MHYHPNISFYQVQAYDAHEEMQIPDSETDQAKLLLELQKENRELRMRLAHQQQKLITIQKENLAANSSPAPSIVSSILSPAPSSAQANEKRKARPSFMAGNCFTPESKRKGADDPVRDLKKVVKGLEAEIERLKKDHVLQIKQKDDTIRELSRKSAKPAGGTQVGGVKRIVTRASLRPREPHDVHLKSPSHRFHSPAPTAKKRSFWDITTANSPSVVTLNGRKTRSHVNTETVAAPSMLLQVHSTSSNLLLPFRMSFISWSFWVSMLLQVYFHIFFYIHFTWPNSSITFY